MTAVLLTDVAAVKQFMQEALDDSIKDEAIEQLIREATDAIPRYCNREFVPTAGATRSFEYRPSGGAGLIGWNDPALINVSPFELRKVTKAILDPEVEGGVELTAAQFRLWPNPARDGTYYGIRLARQLPPRPRASNEFPSRRIDITGDWGMAAVPDIIKKYANQTVESWLHLRRDPGYGQNELMHEGEQPRGPDDLPFAVKLGLKSAWMRPLFPR